MTLRPALVQFIQQVIYLRWKERFHSREALIRAQMGPQWTMACAQQQMTQQQKIEREGILRDYTGVLPYHPELGEVLL